MMALRQPDRPRKSRASFRKNRISSPILPRIPAACPKIWQIRLIVRQREPAMAEAEPVARDQQVASGPDHRRDNRGDQHLAPHHWPLRRATPPGRFVWVRDGLGAEGEYGEQRR